MAKEALIDGRISQWSKDLEEQRVKLSRYDIKPDDPNADYFLRLWPRAVGARAILRRFGDTRTLEMNLDTGGISFLEISLFQTRSLLRQSMAVIFTVTSTPNYLADNGLSNQRPVQIR